MNTEVIISIVAVAIILAIIAYFVHKKDKYAPASTAPPVMIYAYDSPAEMEKMRLASAAMYNRMYHNRTNSPLPAGV